MVMLHGIQQQLGIGLEIVERRAQQGGSGDRERDERIVRMRILARQFRTTWWTELVRYVIHGMLHLAGHDDLEAVPLEQRVGPPIDDMDVARLVLNGPLIGQKPDRMIEDHLRLDGLLIDRLRAHRHPPGQKSMTLLHHEIPVNAVGGLMPMDDKTRDAD